jgi:DNA ligase-associated metallophosphoesterase
MKAPAATVETSVAGELLELLPQGAVYWRRQATLFVADAHFGKDASFRALGVAVPEGSTAGTLARLDGALVRTGARRVVFLGDLLHAREGRTAATFEALARWKAARPDLEWTLVRGNHDRRAGDPPEQLGIGCRDEPAAEPPFVLAHAPRASPDGYVLAGHLHPAIDLTGPARGHERLPCFWVGSQVMVLPALGEFTGAASIEPASGDRVYAITGDEVIPILGG